MGKNDGWIALGAILLGALFLKAIFDPNTKVYRCPSCNLTISKNTKVCPRCQTQLSWEA